MSICLARKMSPVLLSISKYEESEKDFFYKKIAKIVMTRVEKMTYFPTDPYHEESDPT